MASTSGALILGLTAFLAAGCDKVPLTAPTESTVTVSTPTTMLPLGGTTQVSAAVLESAGTPVQNGTVVRFTTTLGRFDPVEAQTRNGLATSMFVAGDVSGVAEITASSGGANSVTATATALKINVGAAAVDTVTLRANPASVPATGGTVELAATVLSAGSGSLAGIPVTFTTTEGTLAASRVATDAAGEAKTSLTVTLATGGTAVVTALAGTKTGTFTITRQTPTPRPTVTLTGTPVATKTGVSVAFKATVAGTTDTVLPIEYEWDFDDGQTAVTNGDTIGHVYTTNGIRTPRVTVTLTDGREITASTQIDVVLLP